MRHLFKPLMFLLTLLVSLSAGATGAQKLYLSFEQRVAMTYALLANGETPEIKDAYLDRAENYLQQGTHLPPRVVKVQNFEQFLKAFRGEWPNTQSVALDLQLLEQQGAKGLPTFKSDSPRVQSQIDRYLKWQLEQLKALATQGKSAQEMTDLTKHLMFNSSKILTNRSAAKTLLLQANDTLFAEKMQEFDHIGEKIATSELGKTADAPTRIVLQTLFSEYFARLSSASKKLIVSSYLSGDLFANDMKKFEIMVQNSGPQLQKLLQVVARQGELNPEMLKVFKTLEDSVRPVSSIQVQELLDSEKGNYRILSFDKKPLGVGTMAQVHRAKISVHERRENVVVRFIKPEIEKRVQEDARILAEVATIIDANPILEKEGFPKLAPLVSDITATVTAELSQSDTIVRQKIAAKAYNKTVFMKTPGYKNDIEFHVPGIFDPKNKDSKFMTQEMVLGAKLDKEAATWQHLAPELKKGVAEALASLWGTELMFGSGFYHSDLHQGNFMIRLTDEKIVVNILDFGMGGVISPQMQKQILILGVGIELNRADMIANSFWGFSNKDTNQINETQLRTLVNARLSNLTKLTADDLSVDSWTKFLMNQGLRLPYDFINLNRGLKILDKLLENSGSNLTVSSLVKEYASKHPIEMYRRLIIEGKLSHADVIKLGLDHIFNKNPEPVLHKAPVILAPSCQAVFL
ncbi:MAG: AarF/ABC1/UbiB kinase family protein [Bdellovibrio sp.]|nr:AarF/ABC1/UbiB kinase family protein [Bdellovibrio sp.]